MTTPALESAPVLSTPDTHIFEDPTPAVDPSSLPRLSDEQVALTYEIERTVREIREGQWKRIALQFPDHMLGDAPRVYEHLSRGLRKERKEQDSSVDEQNGQPLNGTKATTVEDDLSTDLSKARIQEELTIEEKLFILGDTSYGACCVDEVAAEHVDADVVVHYGRSCLSPRGAPADRARSARRRRAIRGARGPIAPGRRRPGGSHPVRVRGCR